MINKTQNPNMAVNRESGSCSMSVSKL